MFEQPTGAEAPSLDDVHAMAAVLSRVGAGLDDPARVDMLRALETLKCAAEGAQAVVTADFETSQQAAQAAAGVPAEEQGRGIAAQVALARRESPHRGQRHLKLARVLRREMPRVGVAVSSGQISEWRAQIITRETECLSRLDRARVDRRLAGDPEALAVLEAMGDRELAAATCELAYQLDPVSFVDRRRKAEADRRVTLRPAPDVMAQLSALLPVRDGVAVWAVLSREADQLVADGDGRSRDQIMADTLVQRVLNPGHQQEDGRPRLMINVVVPDTVLLGDEHGLGWVERFGPVPGDLLREWIAQNAETGVKQWVRRLYVTPKTGSLVAMDARGRLFKGQLAEYLRLRDQRCRTRYCNALVRHLDHAEPHAEGGPTSASNGQGLCEACNHGKQALGWSARPRPGPRHAIETVTPTGHTYLSTAPAYTAAERKLVIELGLIQSA